MKRINSFITDDSFEYLKSRPSTISEHVRFAVEAYVHKLRQEETRLARNLKVSASASKKREVKND